MSDQQEEKTKAGFVALIRAPNAGKSTFMNAMVGQKISLYPPKVEQADCVSEALPQPLKMPRLSLWIRPVFSRRNAGWTGPAGYAAWQVQKAQMFCLRRLRAPR